MSATDRRDPSRRFAVVDVETSGLSAERHHLLQVGVVVTDLEGVVHDRWSSLVHPRARWCFRVGPTELHGIRWRDARRAPAAHEVLPELARRIDGAVFVAHNAAFDLAFLRVAFAELDLPFPVTDVLCTLDLSRRLDPGRRHSHRLADLCRRHDIELVRPHDALADADATAALLPRLLAAHGLHSDAQIVARLADQPAAA